MHLMKCKAHLKSRFCRQTFSDT